MSDITEEKEAEEKKAKEKQAEILAEYRKLLVTAEQKSQEDFDKTVLSLSGGALGISFVFLKDVIGSNPIMSPTLLLIAWIAWGFSTFAVLTSFYLSRLALLHAISQVDAGTIYDEQQPGGVYSRLTAILNASGAILFLVGVLFITMFAGYNLSNKGLINDRKEVISATSNTATKPKTQQSYSTPATATSDKY